MLSKLFVDSATISTVLVLFYTILHSETCQSPGWFLQDSNQANCPRSLVRYTNKQEELPISHHMRLWNIISETSRHHVSHTTHLSLSQHISLGSTASICEPMYILSDSLPMWATKSLYEPANRYVSLQISMWATKSPREPPNLYVSLQISTWATKSLFEPPHRYVSQQIFWSQICWLQNVRTWASMLSQAVLGLYRVLWSAMHFANLLHIVMPPLHVRRILL